MKNVTEKCLCGHESELKLWTRLSVSSTSGNSSLVGETFKPDYDRRINIGSVDLFACPECGTVKFISREKLRNW